MAEDSEILVPHGLSPSEVALYRLLISNGYRVLRHGWPDYFVVPGDGSPGFAVEVKSGYGHVRPDQKEMHAALEQAGVRVLVVKEPRASRKRGRPRVLSDEQRRERVRKRVADWRAAKAGKTT